jgi:hypothetical protein
MSTWPSTGIALVCIPVRIPGFLVIRVDVYDRKVGCGGRRRRASNCVGAGHCVGSAVDEVKVWVLAQPVIYVCGGKEGGTKDGVEQVREARVGCG